MSQIAPLVLPSFRRVRKSPGVMRATRIFTSRKTSSALESSYPYAICISGVTIKQQDTFPDEQLGQEGRSFLGVNESIGITITILNLWRNLTSESQRNSPEERIKVIPDSPDQTDFPEHGTLGDKSNYKVVPRTRHCPLTHSNSPLSWGNHCTAKRKIPKRLVFAQVSPLGSPFALYDPITLSSMPSLPEWTSQEPA